MQFLSRKVYFELKRHLNNPEMSVILGPRQAGKTTLMLKIMDELKAEGKPCLYLNLDILEDKQYFLTQHTLINYIQKKLGKEGTVFLDEVHRLENAGLFLKGLYDMRESYKFVVSGSGSLELKASILEPMTGRKREFLCMPLSFSEFAANKLSVDFKDVSAALDTNKYEYSRLMDEYLAFGGYPRVVLSQTYEEKFSILSEIYKSYVERDIEVLLRVEKSAVFESLVRILANQVGNMVNKKELASTLGVTERTINKYIYLLEKTFILAIVRPFYSRVRKEITKAPKVFFMDLGLLALAQGRSPEVQSRAGGTFENACYLRLNELNLLDSVKFWRSKMGAEVDFVVRSPKTGKIIPVEVKSSVKKERALSKSLLSFIDKYKPDDCFIYNRENYFELERGRTKISGLPYHYSLPLAN
ncbi:MAG: ATP-binding protein [Patescibacteria group bacterium]